MVVAAKDDREPEQLVLCARAGGTARAPAGSVGRCPGNRSEAARASGATSSSEASTIDRARRRKRRWEDMQDSLCGRSRCSRHRPSSVKANVGSSPTPALAGSRAVSHRMDSDSRRVFHGGAVCLCAFVPKSAATTALLMKPHVATPTFVSAFQLWQLGPREDWSSGHFTAHGHDLTRMPGAPHRSRRCRY